jgi:hypothetical protein
MKEHNYLLDERSTTIDKILQEEKNPNMEEVLGIRFDKIFEGESSPLQTGMKKI